MGIGNSGDREQRGANGTVATRAPVKNYESAKGFFFSVMTLL